MRQRKPPFTEPQDGPDAEEPVDYSFIPTEEAFEVTPNTSRRQLTPRDLEHNRNVQKLFDHRIPGLPIDADPPETRHDAEPIAAAIDSALLRLNLRISPWLEELTAAWPRLVPPEVAAVARPGKWEDGILYLYVSSSIALFELRRHRLARIETAVRAFAGDRRVRQVRLLLNAVTLPGTPSR